MAGEPSGGEPSGGDPSGGDPSGGDPSDISSEISSSSATVDKLGLEGAGERSAEGIFVVEDLFDILSRRKDNSA